MLGKHHPYRQQLWGQEIIAVPRCGTPLQGQRSLGHLEFLRENPESPVLLRSTAMDEFLPDIELVGGGFIAAIFPLPLLKCAMLVVRWKSKDLAVVTPDAQQEACCQPGVTNDPYEQMPRMIEK